jgi:hypothetical protein
MQSMNGLEEAFEDSRKKFLQPMRSGCLCFYVKQTVPVDTALTLYLEESSEGSPPRFNVSVHPSVWNTKTRRFLM